MYEWVNVLANKKHLEHEFGSMQEEHGIANKDILFLSSSVQVTLADVNVPVLPNDEITWEA